MVEHTEQMVLAHRDLDELREHAEDYMQDLADQASFVYEDPAGLITTLWRRGPDGVLYDARRDVLAIREGDRERCFPASAEAHGSAAFKDALEYWGNDISEAMT